MALKDKQIREILKNYDLGSLKSFKYLGSGHHSDSYLIVVDSNSYVLRVHYSSEKDVKYFLKVYEYLVSRGIKTSKAIPTIKGKLYLKHNNMLINIQTFLDGKPGKRSKKLFPVYGKQLGKVQSALAKLKLKGKKEQASLKSLRYFAKKYIQEDNYLREQYASLKNELSKFPLKQLTKAIIHADCGLEDFLFKNGKFTGILDFGDAGPDYVLYDIATTIMYCRIFTKDKEKEYLSFIKAYLKEFPLPKKELKALHAFLKVRFLLQALYHMHRFKKGIIQGVSSQKDNLQGIEDGKNMLKQLEKVPEDFYFKAL